MRPESEKPITWDFEDAIGLLKTFSVPRDPQRETLPDHGPDHARTLFPAPQILLSQPENEDLSLGNFNKIWAFLSPTEGGVVEGGPESKTADKHVAKEVRWRDEVSGADLEDNVDPEEIISAASARTQKRAARRARALERRLKVDPAQQGSSEMTTSESPTDNESEQELATPKRPIDRRAVINDLLFGPGKTAVGSALPTTSPSSWKEVRVLKKERPVSNPFVWSPASHGSHRREIIPLGDLSPAQRKKNLIGRLIKNFPSDKKYLKNEGLIHPEFVPLNATDNGIHVFVDISNIMIGFHDCLKLARNIPATNRIRRVPMSFHNFSMILERGRPAAKRVVVGSDKVATIDQAKSIGYETNILERVHKVKTPKPYRKGARNESGTSGVSSGNESENKPPPEKWVEQAVDEILHLKILESLFDTEAPSVITIASGDAAESEYSGGFMKMVERALQKGWRVEVVSFVKNTSNSYRNRNFTSRWGSLFKWIPLDDYVEDLVDDHVE